VQRLLDVALDAKLTLASDPAGFLASLRARAQDDSESWDPSCSLDLEEEAEGQVGSDVSLALDPDDSSLALSLPGSFDRDLYRSCYRGESRTRGGAASGAVSPPRAARCEDRQPPWTGAYSQFAYFKTVCLYSL
jgi:hypothetical protein